MMNKKVPALVVEYQWEHTALRVLLIMILILTAGYLYLVARSVFNVIAYKEADVRSAQLETSIGLLEQHYFTLSQNLTPEEGNALGLSAITDQSYVYRHTIIGQAEKAPAVQSEI